MNNEELAERIREAIKAQREAIAYYEKLIRMLKDKRDQENVEHILEDEKQHCEQFNAILRTYTGESCEPECHVDVPESLRRALSAAIMDELEAQEMYKRIVLDAEERIVRDVFFSAMMDEIEHAIRLTYLYAKHKDD